MFKAISNWWNRDKIRMQQLADKIAAIEAESKAAIAAAHEETQRAAAEAEELRAAADHSTSTEPWVEIKSDRIDPIKGLVIELDWNDAFIQYLKDNGITGRDPETAVQKWIAMLYQNILGELEEIAIEKTEEHSKGDFE